MTDYGEGFGLDYEENANVVADGQSGRREKVITRMIGTKRVTIKIRDSVAPCDPVILLTKAALYVKQVPGAMFPAPAISRRVKEALIKVAG